MMNNETKNLIESTVNNNEVVLFMKGSSDFPQCGFSGLVVAVLQKIGVTFHDINVLEDNDLREGIKEFSEWPTIPQLYVKGEFIGGCDIIKEMYENGDLLKLMKDNDISCQ